MIKPLFVQTQWLRRYMSKPFSQSDWDATCQKCTELCWHFHDNVPLPFFSASSILFFVITLTMMWRSITNPSTHKKFLLKVTQAYGTKTLYASICPQCILQFHGNHWPAGPVRHCHHCWLALRASCALCSLLTLPLSASSSSAWPEWRTRALEKAAFPPAPLPETQFHQNKFHSSGLRTYSCMWN